MSSLEMQSGGEYNKYPENYQPNSTIPMGHPSFQAASPPYPSNPPFLVANSSNPLPSYTSYPKNYYSVLPHPGVIVTTQPAVMAPSQPPQRDYLAWSIINLIFCNLILGILAVIYSSKARESKRNGDSAMAAIRSMTAFRLNIAGTVLGISGHIAWIAFVIYYSVTPRRYYGSYTYYYYG